VRSAIISIEGAPGVGKSTIAAALARHGAFVVPEVNQLFAKPNPEPPDWYYDRQNARWEMAQLKAAQGRLAVLDGDPFQPIWFSWIFQDQNWPPISDAVEFYRRRIADDRMEFPSLYVFAWIAEAERRERMLARERSRGLEEGGALRKTAHYARMVEPQRRFFTALADRFPGWVSFVETRSLDETLAGVRAAQKRTARMDGLEALNFIAEWTAKNSSNA